MDERPAANEYRELSPLLRLIEQRFGLTLTGPVDHLQGVQRHYREKREFLLAGLGESAALASPEYAKAFLISEASRLMLLREIMPRPKKKKNKGHI